MFSSLYWERLEGQKQSELLHVRVKKSGVSCDRTHWFRNANRYLMTMITGRWRVTIICWRWWALSAPGSSSGTKRKRDRVTQNVKKATLNRDLTFILMVSRNLTHWSWIWGRGNAPWGTAGFPAPGSRAWERPPQNWCHDRSDHPPVDPLLQTFNPLISHSPTSAFPS